MNPTGYAQASEEIEVVAGSPSSWVRTRSTVVGLDVLSTSTPRFAFGGAPGHDPDPQPDAPLVMVYDAGGSVRDLLADHVAPGDLFTFAGNADGSSGVLPDSSNPVFSQRADYDAFGALILFGLSNTTGLNTRLSQREAAITGLEQALVSHLTYRGEQFDVHLRMQYLRARHYDQATGRFTRLDPFAGVPDEPLTLHKYAFASSDPVNGMDPTGLFTMGEALTTFSLVTFLVGILPTAAAGVVSLARGQLPDAIGWGVFWVPGLIGAQGTGVGPLVGAEITYFPKHETISISVFGGFEVESDDHVRWLGGPGSLLDKVREARKHSELGVYQAWYWNTEPGTGFEPFAIAGWSAPGGLFGALEASPSGGRALLAGFSSDRAPGGWGVGGASWTPFSFSTSKPFLAVSAVAANTAFTLALESKIPTGIVPKGLTLGGLAAVIVNAGLISTWIALS